MVKLISLKKLKIEYIYYINCFSSYVYCNDKFMFVVKFGYGTPYDTEFDVDCNVFYKGNLYIVKLSCARGILPKDIASFLESIIIEE